MPRSQYRRLFLLESRGRMVGQRRMESLAIVDNLDELADSSLRLIQIPVATGVDLLALQGFHEALRHSVVPRAADPAHARLNAGFLQTADVVAAGILHAAIGMMDQAARDHLTGPQSH